MIAMLIIGLTGSIGMGKSETAKLFLKLGVPVFDSDQAVHALYEPGGEAVEAIARLFPDSVSAGRVSRQILSRHVVGDDTAIKKLEEIVHPLVARKQMEFLAQSFRNNAALVVLDIPLLFETGGEHRVDVVVVVSAPPEIQQMRVLARQGMTEEKLKSILAKQVPDEVKRARADFVVDTSKGFAHAEAQIKSIIDRLRNWPAKVWREMNA